MTIRDLTRAGLAAFCLVLMMPVQARDWPHVGGDAGGQRFSPATEVTAGNVTELEQAWSYSTGDAEVLRRQGRRWKFQGTPILFQSALVTCTPLNDVIALNPGTGVELWRYRHPVRDLEPTGNGLSCRGVAGWHDPDAGRGTPCASRIFTGTNNMQLLALDARTGRPCADFGHNGRVAIDVGVPMVVPAEAQITSPPVVARGVVLVGSAMGDGMRVAAPSGAVRAFDARSGEPLWQFDPVPRDVTDPAYRSWGPDGPGDTGHANVWSLMSVDESRGLFFIPTSSPSVDHYGGTRPGDNRYANSTVALDARTGAVVWHFQTVHHDLWDYDVAAQPTLVTLKRDGADVPAVIQPTKMGLIFTLHRDTGEPIFAVEERPVPSGDVPGEWYAPTQPFPVAPPMLVPEHLHPSEAWGLTWFDQQACRRSIRRYRYNGIYTPPSLQGSIHYPFISGGVNWGSGAFDPVTQTLYVLTNNAAGLVQLLPREAYPPRKVTDVFQDGISAQAGTPYLLRRELLVSPFGAPCNPPPWGQIHAIDMKHGTIRWQQTIGTLEDIVPWGHLWLPHGSGNMGGPVVTAGGVVFVAATMDDYLRALSAETGNELWKVRLPAGGQATPMTYVWQGRQHIVVAAGGHSVLGTTPGDWVVAFARP